MTSRLKGFARAVAPMPVRAVWGRVYGRTKIRRARQAFEQTMNGGGAAFLPADALPALMRDGYRPPDTIRYDADGLVRRADEKVGRLARVLDLSTVRRALELGCWDGMVGAALARMGISIVGLDIVSNGFDSRAARSGVRFLESDAEAIGLLDASVDLAYSFASFEHFRHPEACVQELARVLRPGGHVYLDFGPLYFSPYGRHAYRQIPIPFCHLLFEEEELHRWAGANGLAHDWPYVNGWALRDYRALWGSLPPGFEVTAYHEHTTGGVGAELIVRYPQCFRRVGDFDELLVSHVEIVLRRQ